MASILGNGVSLACPVCESPIVLPLTQTGVERHSTSAVINVAVDMAAFRQHFATKHPHQENVMSVLTGRFHDLVTQLEAEGHHLADEARSVFNHYEHEAAAVVDGVKPVLTDLRTGITADLKAVLTEAKTEGADVVARVEAAVAKLEALVKQTPAGS